MSVQTLSNSSIGVRSQRGFTLVELATVISVIAILATITVFTIGNWRTRTAQGEVQSDLNGVAAAMENAKNFSNGYPATIPTSFQASPNVTVTLKSSTTTSYCAEAASKAVPSVVYSVSSTSSTPVAGIC
jgi:prepilin-type N-terminal cleavage/methylation domain-containing protein